MSLNILLIAHIISPLSADDQWVSDRLTGAGYTVTPVLDTAVAPSLTSVDLVIFCRSAIPTNTGTKYDNFTGGAIGLGMFPHSVYATTAAASATGNQTTIYVLPAANGDFLAFGATGTVTVTTVAGVWLYTLDTNLGSGCVKVLAQTSGTTNRICGSHYDLGTTMADGSTTAPSRRVHLGMSAGYVNSNSTQQGMFDSAVTWATSAPTAKPANVTAHVLAVASLAGSASGITGTAIWSWNHISGPSSNASLSSTTTQNPSYTAPASASTPDVWSLTVTDSATSQSSLPATCTVTYLNTAPIASAGGPYTQQATGTSTTSMVDVSLSGAGSSDFEGSSLTHSWRVVSTTAISATLLNATSLTPTLRVSKYGGTTTVGNTVTDSGGVASVEATTTVTVHPVAYKWFAHNGVIAKRQRFTAHNGVLV